MTVPSIPLSADGSPAAATASTRPSTWHAVAPITAVSVPLSLENPGQPGSYTVQTLSYGSGSNTRRPQYGAAANRAPLLTGEEQQQTAKVLITSFLNAALRNENAYRGVFRSPGKVLHLAWELAPAHALIFALASVPGEPNWP